MNDIDAQVVRVLQAWASGNELAQTVTVACAKWLEFVVPLVLAVVWWWPPEERATPYGRRRVLVASGVTALLGGGATLLLSTLVDRPRPFVVLDLVPLFPHAADSSFPSDHTLLGAALAAPLVWRMWRLGVPLLAVALLAGFGRVAAAVHWPSDIVGTTLLALVLGAVAVPLTGVVLRRVPHPWLVFARLAPAPAAPPTYSMQPISDGYR